MFTTHATMLGRALASTGQARRPTAWRRQNAGASWRATHGVRRQALARGRLRARGRRVHDGERRSRPTRPSSSTGARRDADAAQRHRPRRHRRARRRRRRAPRRARALRDLARALPRRGRRRRGAARASRAATSSTTRASTCCSTRSRADRHGARAAPIVLFVLVPAGNSGLRGRDAASARRRSTRSRGAPLGISTHNLFDAGARPDPRSTARALGLDNAPRLARQGDPRPDLPARARRTARPALRGGAARDGPHRASRRSTSPGATRRRRASRSACRRSRPTARASAAGCASRASAREDGVYVLARVERATTTRSSRDLARAARAASWREPPDRDALARRCRAHGAAHRVVGPGRALPRGLRARARRGGSARSSSGVAAAAPAGAARACRAAAEGQRPRLIALRRRRRRCRRRCAGLERLARNYLVVLGPRGAAPVRGALAASAGRRAGHNPIALPARRLSRGPRAARRATRPTSTRLRARAARASTRTCARARRTARARRRGALSREHPVAYFCAEFGIARVAADLQRRPRRPRRRPPEVGERPRPAARRRRALLPHGLPAPAARPPTASRSRSTRENDPRDLPLELVRDERRRAARDRAAAARPRARACARGARTVGRVALYLLDADVPANRPEDRDITHHLYGGDHEMRLRQEIVLGRGGVRLLRAARHRAGRLSTSTRATPRSWRSSAWRGSCARRA